MQAMNSGWFTFVLDIPPKFERDVLGRRQPAIQLDVDARAMVQAGLGADYAQQIIMTEIDNFLSRTEGRPLTPVSLVVRIAFNRKVETSWFTSIMGIINSVTMLAIILAGAAIVREREHVTFAPAILYRGAGFAVVWREFVLTGAIGGLVFLLLALFRFAAVAVT